MSLIVSFGCFFFLVKKMFYKIHSLTQKCINTFKYKLKMYFYTNTFNLTRKITKCLTHHCNNLQQLYIFFKYIIIIIYL